MVRLTRTAPGSYKAIVTAIDSGVPPFVLRVYGPDPSHRAMTGEPLDPHCRWMVETSTERFFASLKQAREYVNRFFESAEGHKPHCHVRAFNRSRQWSGSPWEQDPDNYWQCDDCGGIIATDPNKCEHGRVSANDCPSCGNKL